MKYNPEDLTVGDMTNAMLERRALPIGKTEFDEWSTRIIEGSHVKAEDPSLRFSLAAMLISLGPTDAFKEDAYFILALRKAAVNQTADAVMRELREEQKQKLEKKQAEATAAEPGVVDGKLLAYKEL